MKKLLILFFCFSFGFLNAQETVTLYIVDGNDDAYQLYRHPSWENPTGEMFVDAENLFMGHSWDPTIFYQIGLRYQSVPIPPGSTIESAYIQFYSFEANNDTTGIRAYCERNVNPLPFTSVDYNISDRERTNHEEFWVSSEWQAFIPGPNQRTHNIWDIVQEVVDLDGWEENNAMVFLFKGTNPGFGEIYPKAACSWEFGGEFYAPVLTITYTAPAGVDEEQLAKSLQVFPNPVSDKFTVSLTDIEDGKYSLSIYDLQGKKVSQLYEGTLTHGDHKFDQSASNLHLQYGVYLLSIRGNQKEVCRKIIIQ